MNSRRQFIQNGTFGILSGLMLPTLVFAETPTDFEGLVVNEDEGEAVRLRDGT